MHQTKIGKKSLLKTSWVWCLLILISFQSFACVNSSNARKETEVKLPPKGVRLKPSLNRGHQRLSLAVEPLEDHTPNWVNPDMKKQLVNAHRDFDKTFSVTGFGPFIIISNIKTSRLEEVKESIIRASYNAFYKDFFSVSPTYITTVYLFKNQADYSFYSRKLFQESPNTPYGYYRSSDRAMLINLSTGTGTLVHEMVHAIIDADFPSAPTWFNEGFASLFEQSRIDEGSIVGLNNWRYPILKKAIDTNSFVKLEKLLTTTEEQFYDDQEGYNYAQARYLCYYLQQHGLLTTFYKRFKQQQTNDPSGIKTLTEVVKKDLNSFEKDWIEWAKTLDTSDN
ncbi:MAG: hypothetical protein HY819_19120 [Acidobacteria bacterium]|nr:hypothetical protein [Acidobacteriota bacterium]